MLAYVWVYWRALEANSLYKNGFVVDTCPVCGTKGGLHLEEKEERLFGVPRYKRTVRCASCRSVLREVSRRKWRYAVDPTANPMLYERLNGRIVNDAELKSLARSQSNLNRPKPSFVDEA
jgi:hypothetical protein